MKRSLFMVLFALTACGSANGGGGGGLDLGDGGAPGGGGTASCPAICARQAAANCPTFSMDTCMTQCAQYLASPLCTAQVNALIRCGGTATFTCDSDGEPTSRECVAETSALLACSVPDAGPPRDAN
jgi:hypothetical protein